MPAAIVYSLIMLAAAAAGDPGTANASAVPRPNSAVGGAGDAAAASSVQAPVRASRTLAVAGEFGWNSLAGLGINVMFRPLTRLSLDLGAGLGMGLKAGARARVNLLESNWTPTAGVGALYTPGTGTAELSTVNGAGDSYRYLLKDSTRLQLVIGMEYCGDSGFTFLGTLGRSLLLTRDNVVITSGVPDEVNKAALDIVHGGGFVMGLAFGYSF